MTTYVDGTLVKELQAPNLASASTVNLDTCGGNYVWITGTTTITAITLSQGAVRDVYFSGVLTLTQGTNLQLPGAANIITAVGDTARFRGESGGVVRCIGYSVAANPPGGAPVVLPPFIALTIV